MGRSIGTRPTGACYGPLYSWHLAGPRPSYLEGQSAASHLSRALRQPQRCARVERWAAHRSRFRILRCGYHQENARTAESQWRRTWGVPGSTAVVRLLRGFHRLPGSRPPSQGLADPAIRRVSRKCDRPGWLQRTRSRGGRRSREALCPAQANSWPQQGLARFD